MQQVIHSGSLGVGAGTLYLTPMGSVGFDALENNVQTPMPLSGTATRLFVRFTTAPATGKTLVLTLRVNGADTTLTVTISAGSTSGSDVIHSVNLSAGDLIDFSCVGSDGIATGSLSWSWLYTGVAAIGLGAVDDSNPYYNCPMGGNVYGHSSDAGRAWAPCPTGGTISKLYVHLSAAPGTHKSRTVTLVVYDSSAHNDVTVTISDDATTGNDVAHSHAVAAADRLYLKHTSSGGPTAASILVGWVFTPTTDGQSIVLHGSPQYFSATIGKYRVACGSALSAGTENNVYQVAQGETISALYMWLYTAPGTDKSWTITVRNNDIDTGLAVTVSGTDSTGSTAGPVTGIIDGSRIDIAFSSSGTPLATTGGYGFISVYTGASSRIPCVSGKLWVKGTELHGGDGQGWERYKEGVLTGRTGTACKINYKTGDTVLRYNGYDSYEREIEGALMGMAATPGLLTYQIAGTTHRYGDAASQKREFEGLYA